MNRNYATLVALAGAAMSTAVLSFAGACDLGHVLMGERLAADGYYLPLREIPLGEHRDAVEESIIKTSLSARKHHRWLDSVVNCMALAGSAMAFCGCAVAVDWSRVHRGHRP